MNNTPLTYNNKIYQQNLAFVKYLQLFVQYFLCALLHLILLLSSLQLKIFCYSHSTTQMVRLTTKKAVGIKGTNYSTSRLATASLAYSWHHQHDYPFPSWQKSSFNFETVFLATDIPPLGYKVFVIQRHHQTTDIHTFKSKMTRLRERGCELKCSIFQGRRKVSLKNF